MMLRTTIILSLLMGGLFSHAQPLKIGVSFDIHKHGGDQTLNGIEKELNWTSGFWRPVASSNLSFQKFVSKKVAIKANIGYAGSRLHWFEENEGVTEIEEVTHIRYWGGALQANYHFGKRIRGFQLAIGPSFYKFLDQENYIYTNDMGGNFGFGSTVPSEDVEGLSNMPVFILSDLSFAIPFSFDQIDHGEFVVGLLSSFQVNGIVEADTSHNFYLRGLKIALYYYLYKKEERQALLDAIEG